MLHAHIDFYSYAIVHQILLSKFQDVLEVKNIITNKKENFVYICWIKESDFSLQTCVIAIKELSAKLEIFTKIKNCVFTNLYSEFTTKFNRLLLVGSYQEYTKETYTKCVTILNKRKHVTFLSALSPSVKDWQINFNKLYQISSFKNYTTREKLVIWRNCFEYVDFDKLYELSENLNLESLLFQYKIDELIYDYLHLLTNLKVNIPKKIIYQHQLVWNLKVNLENDTLSIERNKEYFTVNNLVKFNQEILQNTLK